MSCRRCAPSKFAPGFASDASLLRGEPAFQFLNPPVEQSALIFSVVGGDCADVLVCGEVGEVAPGVSEQLGTVAVGDGPLTQCHVGYHLAAQHLLQQSDRAYNREACRPDDVECPRAV